MEIIRKRIADMNRAEYNPRVELRPGDDEYEKLARSINKYGLVEPVVWNRRTNNVVGGHQRLTVLENRGEEETDVSVVDLDPMKEKELNIALNKISGTWDEAKLKAVLDSLGDRASETGFDLAEIEALENNLNELIDDKFLDDELAQLEQTFNLSLKFSAQDRADINAYIKDNGKEDLVRLIIKKAKEEI